MSFKQTLSTLCTAALLGACGGGTLSLPKPTVPVLKTGKTPMRILEVLDIDEVRDVGVGGGQIYVATDGGLLIYPSGGDAAPKNLRAADGLGSDNVLAVAVTLNGLATVATDKGVVEVQGGAVVNPNAPGPNVGKVVAMTSDDQGTLWACGSAGVSRRLVGQPWNRFGETAQCTGLYGSAGNTMWVGTSRGLWYIEDGDVVREHAEGRGLPAGYVSSVVPTQPGQAFALVRGTSESYLAFYNGERWYSYAVPGLSGSAVGLGRIGTKTVLITAGYVFAVEPTASGTGTRMVVLDKGPVFSIRSYRARQALASDVPASEPQQMTRATSAVATVPENHPYLDGPAFVVRPLMEVAPGAYKVVQESGTTYVADRNRGVVALAATPRILSSRNLVAAQDFQLANDNNNGQWFKTDGNEVARWTQNRIKRVAAPAGCLVQSIATGPQGVYLACLQADAPTNVKFYRVGEGWEPLLERTLNTPVAGIPFFGVSDDQKVWAALRVPAEGGKSQMRGVAAIDIQGEAVTYHYRASNVETDGEGALSMPDEVTSIDTGESGNVWMSSIYGAVRIGGNQAIVFGEARGVRGEVVSDLAVGTEGKVWIAAAEGPGYYFDKKFEFRMPASVKSNKPYAISVNKEGHLWGAGSKGLVYWDGDWSVYGKESGLPVLGFTDVECDMLNRVWVLAADRVLLVSPN